MAVLVAVRMRRGWRANTERGRESSSVRRDAFDDLGQDFGATLTEAEVAYSIDQEWTRSAADLVWRRTKLGLRLTPTEIERLDDHIRQRLTTIAAVAS